MYIHIAKEFSEALGARYATEGPNSGEEFYNKHLEPKFKEARERGEKLQINLDGTWGYPSSFISGSFGKLSLKYGANVVLNTIEFMTTESEVTLERIKKEITSPKKNK